MNNVFGVFPERSGNVSEIFRCERAKANDLKSARDCVGRSLNIPKRFLNIPKHSLNIPM